jgi:FAD binding domain/Berberine and berberine like
MNRRAFLKAIGSAALLPLLARRLSATTSFRRRRPSEANWPSQSAWKQLNEAVGGKLVPVNFPLDTLKTDPDGAAAKRLLKDLKNPYYIRSQAGLTQSLGWVDAWATQPSVYAVMARNAQDIAEAVNFARANGLRLAVRGGGHSYQGTSNAADSLLTWTRDMHEIEMHSTFVPQGCEQIMKPQAAVSVGAGTIGWQAYQAVTTKGGKYVQGGGCTTVCLGGLIHSGGFGSFSKHYGSAAGSLLEAEVITADGRIRVANAANNPDLFWALKGGGGGTFGVVSKMTLRVHDLPEFFGTAHFRIKAPSADSYRRLIRQFVHFYREHLFNDHWGEQARFHPDNSLEINMVSYGLSGEEAKKIWQPFLDWVSHSSDGYSLKWPRIITSWPARRMWDVNWWTEHWPELLNSNLNGNPLISSFDYVLRHLHGPNWFTMDDRPGAKPTDAWWAGDGGQVGWFIWGFQSLWLPASLLEDDAQEHLANALFASSRYSEVELHFNKGLAGAPPDAIARSKDTATNPAVLTAFALAIVGDAQGPAIAKSGERGFAYPGIPGHEPSVAAARKAAQRIDLCMSQLRALVPNPGSYVSESNYFERQWQRSYWGNNYPRLAVIKRKYDPDGLFFVHNGVGSEEWSADGFTKL